MPLVDWALVGAVLAKLGFAALLGGAIGLEREMHGRPAGVRTHMLLVVGVTLFAEVSKAFPGQDQSRIASQILTGVGFLGAGTILRLGAEIKGLTTAASLWAVSAIGMAVSTGGAFLVVAVFATVITFFTLQVVESIERRLVPNARPRPLMVTLTSREGLSDVIDRLEKAGGELSAVRLKDNGSIALFDVKGDSARLLAAATTCPHSSEAAWLD